jgi:hypothetical protein
MIGFYVPQHAARKMAATGHRTLDEPGHGKRGSYDKIRRRSALPCLSGATSLDARDAGKGVETGVEAQDPIDLLTAHDGHVHGLARRQVVATEQNLLGILDLSEADGEHLIHNAQQDVETGWIASSRLMTR